MSRALLCLLVQTSLLLCSQALSFEPSDRLEVDSEQEHTVVLAVRQSRTGLQRLQAYVDELYAGHSAANRAYLSRQEVATWTDHSASTDRVLAYLSTAQGVVARASEFGEYVHVTASIAVLQRVFDTSFHSQTTAGRRHIHTDSLRVPAEIAEHLTAVFYTTQIPPRNRRLSELNRYNASGTPNLRAGSVSIPAVTPALINSFYHIESNECDSRATQTVYESIGQYYSPSDVKLFMESFGGDPSMTVHADDGHASPGRCKVAPDACSEANLDAEYMLALCQGSSTSLYYDYSEDFLTWVIHAASQRQPALVQSISYGADESDVPLEYAEAFEIEALKLAAQGVTVLVASGDDGASSPLARDSRKSCGYAPSYPATSKYVTAVGATFGPESGRTETACQADLGGIITSGGGFSRLIERPDWQNAAVDGYFARLTTAQHPVAGYGSGRGVPDVALLGHSYVTSIGGEAYLLSGTSASTPVFAAMVSLVNSARLRLGMGPVGWLNKSLYAYYDKFTNDIVSGNNKCTAGERPTCCAEGFHATEGWDPVTGLGSINFAKFLSVMTATEPQ